ncbi:hypothetical protein SAMN02745121_04222 [Nannocystis exedens]|uniref:PQQ-like domain-containing protein n=1 Tax=Nannocystis exedens TaxID=54 RepID=A0A1I2AHQ0_9BACT|nr:PQQ-binding-like beta-propeller repeat protein [Nannocystis exedens]PCC69797.1 hypothetical protein NAEX_02823 [Nannocystis exedens]SFE42360.1 hypothetical protein SAMN02745121_04222 [Nannocystis exedens]
MRLKNFVPVLLLAGACGPGTPQDGETDGSSSSSTSGGPSTSDTPTTTDAPPTTGDDGTCPNGQPELAPLWSRTIEQEPDGEKFVVGPPLVLSDGRIAVPARARLDESTFAAAVAWFSPEGEPLGWKVGELQTLQQFFVTAAAVGADDTVVVIGTGSDGEQPLPFIGRFDAGAPELTRSGLEAAVMTWPAAMVLHADDTAVLLGAGGQLARVDVDTGQTLWAQEVPGSPASPGGSLALGPAGEIVAAVGIWPNNEDPGMMVARADAAGTLVWIRDLFEPGPTSGELADLVVTPDGQAIVLRRWWTPEEKITATSLALEDGATLWDVDAVAVTPAGSPELLRARAEADALLLPIARRAGDEGPLTVELHRLSLAGQVVDVTPLPLAGRETGRPRVNVTRGRCGELVLLHEELVPWLGSFAP